MEEDLPSPPPELAAPIKKKKPRRAKTRVFAGLACVAVAAATAWMIQRRPAVVAQTPVLGAAAPGQASPPPAAAAAPADLSGAETLHEIQPPAASVDDPCSGLYNHYEARTETGRKDGPEMPAQRDVLIELDQRSCPAGFKPLPMESYSKHLAEEFGRKSCYCLRPGEDSFESRK